MNVTPVAATPPKRTTAPGENPEPVRTTFVPPAIGPVAGDTERMAAATASLRSTDTVIGPKAFECSC